MEFVAGLIVGVFAGMSSWLALAAWLEAQRARSEGGCWGKGGPAGFDGLRERRSHA